MKATQGPARRVAFRSVVVSYVTCFEGHGAPASCQSSPTLLRVAAVDPMGYDGRISCFNAECMVVLVVTLLTVPSTSKRLFGPPELSLCRTFGKTQVFHPVRGVHKALCRGRTETQPGAPPGESTGRKLAGRAGRGQGVKPPQFAQFENPSRVSVADNLRAGRRWGIHTAVAEHLQRPEQLPADYPNLAGESRRLYVPE